MTTRDSAGDVAEPVVPGPSRNAPGMAEHRRRSVRAAQVGLALALVAVTLNHLLDPYNGDLALYASIGDDVVAGRHLYTDVWDIKQPGMYVWYGAVRALLGGSEVSTRVLDVAGVLAMVWLAAGLALGRTAPRRTRATYAAVAATVVLLVTHDELGQTEMVAALPALAALALVHRRPTSRTALIGAGALVGLVAVFKAPLGAPPFLAIVTLVVLSVPAGGRLRALLAVACGGLLVPGLTSFWLWSAGDLVSALETWLVYPGRILAVPGARTFDRLATGAVYFAGLTAPFWALSLWGLWLRWRSRSWDALDRAAITWLVVGVVVVLAQFWWRYQWYVLLPALCVLGIRGLEALVVAWRTRRRAARILAIGLVVISLPTTYSGLFGDFGVVGTATDGAVLTAAGRARILDRVPGRVVIRAEVRAVGAADARSLYVMGEPLYNLEAGRPIALRLNAATPEFFDAGMWHELAVDLDRRRPDLVMVEAVRRDLVRDRGQEFQHVLDSAYRVVRASEAGTWYRVEPS